MSVTLTRYIAPLELTHGGGIIEASKASGIPIEQWLDLSTGINPNGWPVPKLPASTWQRLPESNDGLEQAIKQYYSSDTTNCLTNFVITAGSQSAIQLLPQLFPKGIVWVPEEGYSEHPYWWNFYQHKVFLYRPDDLEILLSNKKNTPLPFDTLLIINPNNPTTQTYKRTFLEKLLNIIEAEGKKLIIDEAFIDTQPEQSLLCHSNNKHLVILRSLGKFFGLAGIRCGALFSHPSLLNTARQRLGPWQVATPSRWVATQALNDTQWQKEAAIELKNASGRLEDLLHHQLSSNDITSLSRSDYFCSILFSNIEEQQTVYRHLLKHTILVRRFNSSFRLRFGLPKDEVEWEKLKQALTHTKI
jgi:cobalamin biosynthetic protein CobC